MCCLFLYARKIWTPAGGSTDVGQSEVVRRKALKTGLSQKILMQTQLICDMEDFQWFVL